MTAPKKKFFTIIAILLILALVFVATSCDLFKKTQSGKNGDKDSQQLYYGIEVLPVHGVEVNCWVGEALEGEELEGVPVGAQVKLAARLLEDLIFEGWEVRTQNGQSVSVSHDSFVMPASNVTVTALVRNDPSLQGDTYRVEVASATGGTVVTSKSIAAAGDSVVLTHRAESGYEFEEYLVCDEEGNSLRVINGVFTMPQSDVTVVGVFRAIQEQGYRVTVLAVEGAEVSYWLDGSEEEGAVEVVPAGSLVHLSIYITDHNTSFLSWEVLHGDRSISVWNDTFTMPSGDVTVRAVLEEGAPSSSIIYENMDGAVNHPNNPSSIGQEDGEVELGVPQKDGYRFLGWMDGHGGVAVYIYYNWMQDEYHLWATWEPITYQIGFVANEGTGSMQSMEATYDTAVVLDACGFLRKGYDFLGWALTQADADRGTVVFADEQEVNNLTEEEGGEVALYAVWEKVTYSILYIENGETQAFYDITSDEVVKAPVGREDMAFVGWLVTEVGDGSDWTIDESIAAGTPLAGHCGDVSLTATYEPFTYADEYSYDNTSHWRACTNAGYADLYTDMGAHDYNVSTVEPTLTSRGYDLHQCKKCAHSYRDQYVDQLSGDLVFDLIYDQTGYAVVGFSGSPASITIPATYNGLPVKNVGIQAFKNCTSLTSVEVPDSVEYIGMAAFEGCSALTEMRLPFAGNTSYAYSFNAVLGYLFGRNAYQESYAVTVYRNKRGTLYMTQQEPADEYTYTFYLPNSLRSVSITKGPVASLAFYGCTSLQTITLGDEVTSVEDNAFYGCTSLQTMTMGTGVTSIGSSVLWGCGSLVDLTVPFLGGGNAEAAAQTQLLGYFFGETGYAGAMSVLQHYSAEGSAQYCLPSSLRSVTLLGGSLGYGSFENCTNLTSVTLPSSLTEIPDRAFSGCSNLESFAIGASLTSIGSKAFSGCVKITSLTIPNTVNSIALGAFSGMSGLAFVEIPFVGANRTAEGAEAVFGYIFGTDSYVGGSSTVQYYDVSHSVTYYIPTALKEVVLTGDRIPYGAFCACLNLQSFTFSKSVKSFAPSSFLIDSWYDALTSIYYDGTMSDWANISFAANASPMIIADTLYCEDEAGTITHNGKKYSIPREISIEGGSIDAYQFAGLGQLTSVEIKEGVTAIGENAFYKCNNIRSFVVPDSVTSIGANMLYGCTSIRELTIGNGVDSLPAALLQDCEAIEKVTLPFVGTTRDAGYSAQGAAVFGAIFGVAATGPNVEYFAQDISDTRSVWVRVPSTLTEIKITGGKVAYGAFSGMRHLTKIELTDGVTFIDKNAFKGCGALTELIMPYVLDEAGAEATKTFGSLFGDSDYEGAVTCGNDYVTYYFPNGLTKITIVSGRISPYGFNFCTMLTEVVVEEGVTLIGHDAFRFCSSIEKITLPFIGTERDHTNRTENTVFGSIFSIRASFSGSTRRIEQKFDYGSTERRDYFFPATLKHVVLNGTEVPAYAFYGCSFLETITLSDEITTIGENAFYGCEISELELPAALTAIDTWAFGNCSNLTALELPDGVVSLGYAAFQGCSALEEITLPAGISVIPGSLFQYDGSLRTVTILGHLTEIQDWAFRDTTQLTTVVYAGSEEEWDAVEKGSWWRSNAGAFTVLFDGEAE